MSRRPTEIHPETLLVSRTGTTYSLVSSLGQGGNATSFVAVCQSGEFRGTPFAAKLLMYEGGPRREAFLREISYLQNHPHPAILTIYDSGVLRHGGLFYISRLMSATLTDVMRSGTTPVDRFLYATQICAALAFLARADPPIVHRDLKPKNVFVNGRTCVLGDFGMMYGEGEKSIEPGMPRGYRTPELVAHLNGSGPPPTTRSDVFQLGLVLCELFSGANPLAPCARLTDELVINDIPPLSGDLSFLADLIAAMLRLDPSQRPSAETLLNSLLGLLDREVQRGAVLRT